MDSKNQHIREQAAKWFTRLQNAAVDHPDRGAFEAWLLQSPKHAQEYATITATWEDFDSTPKLESLANAMQHSKQLKQQKRKKVASMVNKLAAISLVLVVGLFSYQSWQQWQAQPLMQMAQASNIGQVINQALPDGSKLTLNANSDVEIAYYRDRREVKLKQGEVIFEVTKDAERPFIVQSDIARVTVLGTRFLVNRIDNRVLVGVDHGRVRVESNQAKPQAPMILTNGQMAEVSLNAQPIRLTRNAADAFGFIEGKLVFEEASLNEVAETLSRYRQTPVVAIYNTSKPVHITAVMNIKDTESFISALPKIADVQVIQNNHQTQLISKK